MIGVHVGDHDDVDLVGAIAGRLKALDELTGIGAPGRAVSGIEKHEGIARVHQYRGKADFHALR